MSYVWPLPPLDWPTYESEGWILDEDRAVRDLMKGMVVSDQGNRQRPVEAWFGHPDQELREQKYPYVTVDLISVQEGLDRVHRGDLYIGDPPKWWGLEPLKPWQIGYLLEMPTPVDLDYQISTWARNPRHDRQIIFQMHTGGRLMLRGGLLYTADKKIRRLDFLGHVKRDTVESGKRLFNNVYRIRVSSEVPWGIIGSNADPIDYGFGPVTGVHLKFLSKFQDYGLTLDERVRIVAAEIVTIDDLTHKASVLYEGKTYDNVQVISYLLGLGVEDIVAMSIQEDKALTSDQMLVIGLEKRADQ